MGLFLFFLNNFLQVNIVFPTYFSNSSALLTTIFPFLNLDLIIEVCMKHILNFFLKRLHSKLHIYIYIYIYI